MRKNELVGVVCKVCDFYKESGEQLECGAFKIIGFLLKEGKISKEDLSFAAERVSEAREKDTPQKL